jgi:hypothetical protein
MRQWLSAAKCFRQATFWQKAKNEFEANSQHVQHSFGLGEKLRRGFNNWGGVEMGDGQES